MILSSGHPVFKESVVGIGCGTEKVNPYSSTMITYALFPMNLFGTSTLADVPMEFTVLSKNPLIFFSFSVKVPCFSSTTLGTITVIYR